MYMHMCPHTDTLTDTDRQTQIHRQTDRHIDRQTDSDTCTHQSITLSKKKQREIIIFEMIITKQSDLICYLLDPLNIQSFPVEVWNRYHKLSLLYPVKT